MKSKKSLIPWIFIALVGIFMLLDFAFVKLAYHSYSGTYTDNHYQKGVDYNKVYKSGIYDDKTGWHGIAEFGEDYSSIIFKLMDSEERPITDADVQAKILRPVTADYDMLIQLKNIGNGFYTGVLNLPLEGQWEIRVRATKGNDEYVMTERIYKEDESENEEE